MVNKQNKAIGIFDSGIGGSSIWKEINKLLPYENTIYLADSKNAPYGQKSKDKIVELSIKNTEYLLEQNCKLIVVACNTATTNAIQHLRKTYKVPFIGIEPAIKPASISSKTRSIGILATKGTLNSQLFSKTANTLNNIIITEQIGTGLVELIEEGKINSVEMDSLLKKHLSKFNDKNIDSLVLGCTHYPYLIPQIRKIINSNISIIDSGFAVAKQTKNILNIHNLTNTNKTRPNHFFYSNTNPEVFNKILDNKDLNSKYLDF